MDGLGVLRPLPHVQCLPPTAMWSTAQPGRRVHAARARGSMNQQGTHGNVHTWQEDVMGSMPESIPMHLHMLPRALRMGRGVPT